MRDCLICILNQEKNYLIEETAWWQIDTPQDISLNGLYFIKTKRHIESLTDLLDKEAQELGGLLQKYSTKSKGKTHALKIITFSLGFTQPHLHFWVLPITENNYDLGKDIGRAVKQFADRYKK